MEGADRRKTNAYASLLSPASLERGGGGRARECDTWDWVATYLHALMNMHRSGCGKPRLDLSVMNMHSARIGRASVGLWIAKPGKQRSRRPREWNELEICPLLDPALGLPGALGGSKTRRGEAPRRGPGGRWRLRAGVRGRLRPLGKVLRVGEGG